MPFYYIYLAIVVTPIRVPSEDSKKTQKMSYQKEMNILNQMLKETTKYTADNFNTDGQSTSNNSNSNTNPASNNQPRKPLSEEDKNFLKKVIDEVKGHKDIVEEITELMNESISENFEILEEYAFDIDLATAMSLAGLFEKFIDEKENFQNVDSIALGAICCQNNERVQNRLAEADFISKYINYLNHLTNDSSVFIQKYKEKSQILHPSYISLLGNIIKNHDGNLQNFVKNSTVLFQILIQPSIFKERLLIKTLFLVSNLPKLIQKEFFIRFLLFRNEKLQNEGSSEKLVPRHFLLDLLDSKIFPESLDYSEQILKLTASFYEVLPCKDKNDDVYKAVKSRVDILEKQGLGDENFSMLMAKLA